MKKHIYLTILLNISCFANIPISLDGIKMNVPETDANGVVNHETIFTFSQNGDEITAEYSGGQINRGFLVGRFTQENQLEFSYCQMQVDGKLDNGASECIVSMDEVGKIILKEHFEWTSRPGEFGINVFKEL